jgi:cytochrome P450
MAWTFQLLAETPAAAEKLHAELAETLGDRVPGYEDLARLPYLRAVVFESLRLRPPVWTVARRCVEPFDAGGRVLPPGTVVIVSPWVSHRQARWFDDPETFRPDRWLDADPRRTHRGKYFPFGGGRRVCIGEHFALMEMQLLLATIAGRFAFERADARPVRMQPTITIRPRGGLRMRLSAA